MLLYPQESTTHHKQDQLLKIFLLFFDRAPYQMIYLLYLLHHFLLLISVSLLSLDDSNSVIFYKSLLRLFFYSLNEPPNRYSQCLNARGGQDKSEIQSSKTSQSDFRRSRTKRYLMASDQSNRPHLSSNSTNSTTVVPVFFTALGCPASCHRKSPSCEAIPRSAAPGTISSSTPPRTQTQSTVSYTHLTLPTNREEQISEVAE